MPPTETPLPTATATAVPPTPTPVPTEVAEPWLRYLNLVRAQGGVQPVTRSNVWSEGSRLHSVYMLNTGQIWHSEDINSPWYTAVGDTAAKNGLLAISGWESAPDTWPIDYWMSATFHMVPLLDAELQIIGYGIDRNGATDGKMAGTMDVEQGLRDLPADFDYPVTFPQDGGETWVVRYSLPEFPNPLTSCPGFQKPTGPPLVVQIGAGDQVPRVDESFFFAGATELNHCIIDETSYFNSKENAQRIGRTILDKRDAIVLIPQKPLEVGVEYTVTIVVNNETIRWTFTAVNAPIP